MDKFIIVCLLKFKYQKKILGITYFYKEKKGIIKLAYEIITNQKKKLLLYDGKLKNLL